MTVGAAVFFLVEGTDVLSAKVLATEVWLLKRYGNEEGIWILLIEQVVDSFANCGEDQRMIKKRREKKKRNLHRCFGSLEEGNTQSQQTKNKTFHLTFMIWVPYIALIDHQGIYPCLVDDRIEPLPKQIETQTIKQNIGQTTNLITKHIL